MIVGLIIFTAHLVCPFLTNFWDSIHLPCLLFGFHWLIGGVTGPALVFLCSCFINYIFHMAMILRFFILIFLSNPVCVITVWIMPGAVDGAYTHSFWLSMCEFRFSRTAQERDQPMTRTTITITKKPITPLRAPALYV